MIRNSLPFGANNNRMHASQLTSSNPFRSGTVCHNPGNSNTSDNSNSESSEDSSDGSHDSEDSSNTNSDSSGSDSD